MRYNTVLNIAMAFDLVNDFVCQQIVALRSQMNTILGNEFPIICGEFTQPWMTKNKEACDAVLTAMKRVLENDGYGTVVSSEGAEVNDEATGNGDILHFSRNGIHLLGRRYFEAFEKLTKNK